MRRLLSFFFVFTLIACTGDENSTGELPPPDAPSFPNPVGDTTEHPIMFVTQMPIAEDFATIASTFGNHKASLYEVGRGGDLWIRYSEGELKNLTRAAGFGDDAKQGENAIAVREPEVHWDGDKAIFSMVVGAPSELYDYKDYYWQLYEITGLGKDDTPVISKVPNQPENYNNISPIYASDDSILFTSDRPRDGQRHLYPQLDEYEMTPTNTGLWKLGRGGELTILDHSPSGNFTPLVDSFGRVVFTRWDHLQRDQLADDDALSGGACRWCSVDYASEDEGATYKDASEEIFPEPRPERTDLLADTTSPGHRFNHFMPWMINQDGSELETLNHIGRHELSDYFPLSRTGDEALSEWYYDSSSAYPSPYKRNNLNPINHLFQMSEDPNTPGRYLGTNAPEFFTHAAGQLVMITAPPGTSAEDVTVDYLTHPDTANASNTEDADAQPSPNHSGLWRDPLPLARGELVAVHAGTTELESDNAGTRAAPVSKYSFRLRSLVKEGDYYVGGEFLTDGIRKDISYYDPDVEVRYSGELWELNPVEVRPRKRPYAPSSKLPNVEAKVFEDVGVSLAEFKTYLRENKLALVVSRDVTVRDDGDKQQPFNLRVAGSSTQSSVGDGNVYDVSHLQFFEAQLLRARTQGESEPRAGRRVLARPMNAELNATNGPAGSVRVAPDGSMAALVPAERALSWQLTDEAGEGVVLERNWLTFQAGEVRVCASCHGLSGESQTGGGEPENSPQALRELLEDWTP